MDHNSNNLHLVMFPFLAFGHISPFIQLSRKLTAIDPTNIRITFITTPANLPRVSSLLPASPSISLHALPLPSVPGLPPGSESTAELTPDQAELLKTAVDAMKPDVTALLSRLQPHPHFIVYDFSMPWVPSVAGPLGVKSLFFTVFSAIANAYLMVPSRRAPGVPPPTAEDLMKPPPGFPATSAISVAGGVPAYQAEDFSYIFKSYGGPSVYDRFTACVADCTAVISKSCREMEEQYISYLESEYKKPMLLVGPVVPEPPLGELEERWGGWLNKFEHGSVIFCSFGSETFLKEEGMRELLVGLEVTGLPFLVVLNSPEGEESMRRKVPEGFEERVKGRGLVHYGWVPQQLILQHRSVGCYVNHSGFSSVVEGLVADCQLVMMPQRGDQYLNSALFSGDLGIGVEARRDETTGDFSKEAICEAVNKVMDHHNIRNQNQGIKWKDFLMNRGMEERFMVEFVDRLRALALS